MNLEILGAKVYKKTDIGTRGETYYVSVDLGLMKISGITVSESIRFQEKEPWWVSMPGYRQPKTTRFHKYIEFPDVSELRDKIKAVCIREVMDYRMFNEKKSNPEAPDSQEDPLADD